MGSGLTFAASKGVLHSGHFDSPCSSAFKHFLWVMQYNYENTRKHNGRNSNGRADSATPCYDEFPLNSTYQRAHCNFVSILSSDFFCFGANETVEGLTLFVLRFGGIQWAQVRTDPVLPYQWRQEVIMAGVLLCMQMPHFTCYFALCAFDAELPKRTKRIQFQSQLRNQSTESLWELNSILDPLEAIIETVTEWMKETQ